MKGRRGDVELAEADLEPIEKGKRTSEIHHKTPPLSPTLYFLNEEELPRGQLFPARKTPHILIRQCALILYTTPYTPLAARNIPYTKTLYALPSGLHHFSISHPFLPPPLPKPTHIGCEIPEEISKHHFIYQIDRRSSRVVLYDLVCVRACEFHWPEEEGAFVYSP
jgi:hypothetical protein